ncbi:ribosome recycling factor [Candidatus Gracilibacteria bacterium]|nr:ribosome recycling factor [Candidatus Gracilibacteria bacterium]
MLDKAKQSIEKSLHHLDSEFAKLQLGRANPAMVEGVMVDQYGSMQPVKNIASVSNLDAQTLNIKPWDKSAVHSIAKAITDSGLGLNPQTMADSVMIKVPPLTEERRKEVAKYAKTLAEEAKISVRNGRQDTLKDIKKADDNDELSEDEVKKYENDLQKIVDEANKKIDEKLKHKQEDIMKV